MDGAVATAHLTFEGLSALAVDLRRARQRTPCPACRGEGVRDGRLCAEPDVWAADTEWGRCPYGLLAHPQWAAVQRLDAASHVSPLARWPDGYASWVVGALVDLRAARHDAAERAARRAAAGGGR